MGSEPVSLAGICNFPSKPLYYYWKQRKRKEKDSVRSTDNLVAKTTLKQNSFFGVLRIQIGTSITANTTQKLQAGNIVVEKDENC